MFNGRCSHFHNECIATRHTCAFQHLDYFADTYDCTSTVLRVVETHPNDCRHREPDEGSIDFRVIASDNTSFFQFPYAFADRGGSQAHALPKLTIGEPCILL